MSPNIINLSKRNLTKDEISLLSKDLQFVSTPKHFNKAFLREKLENIGRKLRLERLFRNDERHLTLILKKKPKFTHRKIDAATEFYLSRLEEEILSLSKNISSSNLTK